MDEQQRESFRVEAPLDGEIFHAGRVAPCEVRNLSAGGARVATRMQLATGDVCTLGLPLDSEHERATGTDYASFHMYVLDAVPQDDDMVDYRLQHVTSPEYATGAYQTAMQLVFAAERLRLNEGSPMEGASPMVSTHERRRGLMSKMRPRFSRGSVRGGRGE
ncbi:MAG: PilZ domain [Thermoleophilia bacterium]|nr:PilZ domain [Thermoleophilia bacterium]